MYGQGKRVPLPPIARLHHTNHRSNTDANWGRILCAVGYTPLPPTTISPSSVSVSFIPPTTSADPTPLKLLTNGEPEPDIDEERASVILAEEDLEVLIDLGVEGGQ